MGVVRGREGGEGGGEVWSDLPQIRRWWVEVRSVVAMGHVRANRTGVIDTAAHTGHGQCWELEPGQPLRDGWWPEVLQSPPHLKVVSACPVRNCHGSYQCVRYWGGQ